METRTLIISQYCYPMHTTEIPILTSWSDIHTYACNIIILIVYINNGKLTLALRLFACTVGQQVH